MLPSAPLSTFTVTSSTLLRCGNFICNTVRILVLPSGSVSLLILATDFDLQIVENDCFKNSVLSWSPWRSPVCSPWRSALSLWGLPEWSWKEADSMLCVLLVTWLLLDLDCWRLFLFLCPLECAVGLSVPSSRLFGPTLGAKMILISTLMALFAIGWALSRWMRCPTLTT